MGKVCARADAPPTAILRPIIDRYTFGSTPFSLCGGSYHFSVFHYVHVPFSLPGVQATQSERRSAPGLFINSSSCEEIYFARSRHQRGELRYFGRFVRRDNAVHGRKMRRKIHVSLLLARRRRRLRSLYY